MSYADNPYRSPLGVLAAQADADERSTFITQTYLHLAGAIGLFVALEAILFQVLNTHDITRLMIGSRCELADRARAVHGRELCRQSWAQSAVSPATQYMGLGLYVVAEAVIFLPLLCIAGTVAPAIIPSAAIATLALFAGLTAIVFITRKDFSFLRTRAAFRRPGGDGPDRGRQSSFDSPWGRSSPMP